MSSKFISNFSKTFSVSGTKGGRQLPVSMPVHCLAKKSLKRFALSWKSVTKILLIRIGGIFGILISFKNVLMMHQYFLMPVDGSDNLRPCSTRYFSLAVVIRVE